MEIDGRLQLQALDKACLSLYQRAQLLARAGTLRNPARLRRIDRLIASAIEGLEQEIASVDGRPRTRGAGLLVGMLRGKDLAGGLAPTPPRSSDDPPGPTYTLALRGEGKSIPAPDLLGFLSAQGKTGLLEVTTHLETFSVELHEGDIVHAQVSRTLPDQRLGDLLVAQGSIDRLTLETVRDEWPTERLGVVLLRENFITTDALLTALQSQIQLLFNRLFTAPIARFSFWSGPAVHADQGMRLNAMALILEGARSFDEGSLPA